jgi:hypothetical protein
LRFNNIGASHGLTAQPEDGSGDTDRQEAYMAREYKSEDHQTFVSEMKSDGRDVEHYNGRNFYEGPSIHCDRSELEDVIRASTVRLGWESLGKSGLVVWPL